MTHRTMRALVFVALAAALPAHADTRKAKKHYERGMAAYMIEQYDEAIRAFEEGFKEKPLPQFIFNIALAHEKARRFEEAAKYFQKFIESWPESKDRPDAERHLAAVRTAMLGPSSGTPSPPPETTPRAAAAGAQAEAPKARLALSDSAPLTPSFMSDDSAPPGPTDKPRRWPIWVGVAAGVIAVGVGVGLAVGLTRDQTTVLGAESLR